MKNTVIQTMLSALKPGDRFTFVTQEQVQKHPGEQVMEEISVKEKGNIYWIAPRNDVRKKALMTDHMVYKILKGPNLVELKAINLPWSVKFYLKDDKDKRIFTLASQNLTKGEIEIKNDETYMRITIPGDTLVVAIDPFDLMYASGLKAGDQFRLLDRTVTDRAHGSLFRVSMITHEEDGSRTLSCSPVHYHLLGDLLLKDTHIVSGPVTTSYPTYSNAPPKEPSSVDYDVLENKTALLVGKQEDDLEKLYAYYCGC